ncbi:unnamed protein product [Cuscuta europaea]|nr:unnamed protein product [Cuscuta europaea]
MKLLASDRDDSQIFIAAARKLAEDLQYRANKFNKATTELAEMEERVRRRDREIKDLKAKVKVAESVGMKFDKAKGETPPVPYFANVSKITKQAVIDYQRRKRLNVALEETARQFLGRHLGQFLHDNEDPIKAGIELLDSTPEGKAFIDALKKETVTKSQDLFVDRNLDLIMEHFPKPFDPDELGFDDLFGNTYDRVMEKRQKAIPDDSVQAGDPQPPSSPNRDHSVA